MSIWNKLSELNIKNKEKFLDIFSNIINEIKNNSLQIKAGETEKEDYFLIIEQNRMNSYFVHIVPKEAYKLFKKMQREASNEILGFSIMIGKYNDKEIRASCFGIPCNILVKALFKNPK